MRKLTILFATLTLCVGLWAQESSQPDTVRISTDVLVVFEIRTDDAGVTGWSYWSHDDNIDKILINTTSTEKYGTFSYEEGTLSDQIYNFVRVTETGLKQNSFISGSMTVAEKGDSICLDGEFLCDDGKYYILHFTHLSSAINGDTDKDFEVDFEYYQMSYYLNSDGRITIDTYSRDRMVYVELFTEPNTTEIPAGTFTLSDTQEIGTALASSGFVNEFPVGCYASTLNTYLGDPIDYWFMVSGEITLDYDEYGRLKVAIEATNSYGKHISINIFHKPIKPHDTIMINNADFVILKDLKRENVYTYALSDEDGGYLADLLVKTDTICGSFENMTDLSYSLFLIPYTPKPTSIKDAKPFVVSAEGKDLSIQVDILAADTIVYSITGTGYIGALWKDSKFDYNGEYTAEDVELEQVEEGVVELSATNATNGEVALVFSATLQEDGALAAGEYTDIVPSEGIILKSGEVTPSVIINADSKLWMIQSGTLTVNEDGSMAFEGLNSYDKKVVFTISAKGTDLINVNENVNVNKFLHNGQLLIRKDGKTYNAVGVEL